METRFSASEPGLGYLFQIPSSLLLLLNTNENARLYIEKLDDIDIIDDQGTGLIQLKHRKENTKLTDHSLDLWKTLRIWSTHIINNTVKTEDTVFTIITTQICDENSAIKKIKNKGEQNIQDAIKILTVIAKLKIGSETEKYYSDFLSLSTEQKKDLFLAINIIDNAARIQNIDEKIKNELHYVVLPQHYEMFIERLKGWWENKCIALMSDSSKSVSNAELHYKINQIAGQYKEDSLPIEYLDVDPPEPPNPENDNRIFVQQLKMIMIHSVRIEKAILDFYRAFEQRSKWVRDDLIICEELQTYDKKLTDEWQRYIYTLQDEYSGFPTISDEDQEDFGRKIFKWAEQQAIINIRPQVTEEYIRRGSFHMLADKKRIYWHPFFQEKIKQTIYGAYIEPRK